MRMMRMSQLSQLQVHLGQFLLFLTVTCSSDCTTDSDEEDTSAVVLPPLPPLLLKVGKRGQLLHPWTFLPTLHIPTRWSSLEPKSRAPGMTPGNEGLLFCNRTGTLRETDFDHKLTPDIEILNRKEKTGMRQRHLPCSS
jgi:hypothetical protein